MLRQSLGRIMVGTSRSQEETAECMEEIMGGEASPALVGSFLTALALKGATDEESAGGAMTLRKMARPFPAPGADALDTCGTGGDGKNTFNVSTAAAFVAAAAGVPVIKHGNRSASGKSGSADVLEELGIRISFSPERAGEIYRSLGIVFLFAPLYHDSMRHAAPIRKELGFGTIFNVLGPLANPAGTGRQLLGVYREELVPVMAGALKRLGLSRALVVHGHGGLDEMSVSGKTTGMELAGGRLTSFSIQPEEAGLRRHRPEDLTGGSPAENAEILRELFRGEGPESRRDFLLLNAGAAIYVGGRAESVLQGVELARKVLMDGTVARLVDTYREMSREGLQ